MKSAAIHYVRRFLSEKRCRVRLINNDVVIVAEVVPADASDGEAAESDNAGGRDSTGIHPDAFEVSVALGSGDNVGRFRRVGHVKVFGVFG